MWEAAHTASNYVGFEFVDYANIEDVEIRVHTLQGNEKIVPVYRYKDGELKFVREDSW